MSPRCFVAVRYINRRSVLQDGFVRRTILTRSIVNGGFRQVSPPNRLISVPLQAHAGACLCQAETCFRSVLPRPTPAYGRASASEGANPPASARRTLEAAQRWHTSSIRNPRRDGHLGPARARRTRQGCDPDRRLRTGGAGDGPRCDLLLVVETRENTDIRTLRFPPSRPRADRRPLGRCCNGARRRARDAHRQYEAAAECHAIAWCQSPDGDEH